jgi:hypothetical protein
MYGFLYEKEIKEWSYEFYEVYTQIQTILLFVFLFMMVTEKMIKITVKLWPGR